MKKLCSLFLCITILLIGCTSNDVGESSGEYVTTADQIITKEEATVDLNLDVNIPTKPDMTTQNWESEYFNIIAPRQEVSFLTENQKKYLEDDYTNVAQYAIGVTEQSLPNPTVLEWEFKKTYINISQYTIKIATSADLSDAKEYTTKKTNYSVYNLDMGKTYYWCVIAKDSRNNLYSSEVMFFHTVSTAPRMIFIMGVSNVRDIAGWNNTEGNSVKTGMIYRAGSLDNIAVDGINSFLELGVVTEIEFRHFATVESSKLGSDVNYYHCPINADSTVVTQSNKATVLAEATRKLFMVLSDESNYPMVIHCGGGVDRTGYFSFLINGLLGVEEDALYYDYLLSNFSNLGSGRSSNTITEYLKLVKMCQGESLQEKFYNYIHTVHGVPEDQMDQFINIMLVNNS